MYEKILSQAEMTKEQLEYLCELIRQYKPEKIVEIGVAAGGTSVVLLKYLESINCNAKMYSIDRSERYYRDRTKETGYLIEEYKESECNWISHKLFKGGYSVDFLEEIGREIDLLILDTVHSLPGEILDFLSCYPYLSKNAIVVVHDIILNHIGDSSSYCFATQVLLSSVVGKKITPIDINKPYPEIGAFQVNQDTMKYIDNVFDTLILTWRYMPPEDEVVLYKRWYEKFYNEKQLYTFNQAVELNRLTLRKYQEAKLQTTIGWYRKMERFCENLENKKVYIYGKGLYGRFFNEAFRSNNIDVKGFVVSDGERLEQESIYLSSLWEQRLLEGDTVLVIGVGKNIQKKIIQELNRINIENYIIPPEELFQVFL